MKKFFKGLLILIGLLVLLFLLVPAILPVHTHVERSVEIDASPEEVFTVLADFHQYKHYDPWGSKDPTNQVTITGEGVGAMYEWKGEGAAGSGKTTQMVLDSPRLIETDIEMYEPMQATFDSDWKLQPTDNGTKVTWTYDQDLTYFSRYFGLMMDSMLGPDFERGLKSLKEYVEKNEPESESDPEPVLDVDEPTADGPEPDSSEPNSNNPAEK